jgi:hypothetical protein
MDPDPGGPKSIWIRRIRIRNTAFQIGFLTQNEELTFPHALEVVTGTQMMQ